MLSRLNVALILAVLVLGYVVVSQSKRIDQLKVSSPAVDAKSDPGPIYADLDSQAKCAKQAQIAFRELGFDRKTDNYVNHYNMKLGRCFVQTEMGGISNGVPVVNRGLSDAFEGKVYGTYAWMNNQGKKYGRLPHINAV